MIGVLGAFAEAWGEVRVHKSRVVLSLVGVFLAVFAMTTVTALGLIVAKIQQESSERSSERSSGRPATIAVSAFDEQTGLGAPQAQWDAAVADLLGRYRISTAATISYEEDLFRLPDGTQGVQTMRVSPSFGQLHRIEPIEGRWLRAGDRDSLSPALVVNEAFLDQLGVPDLAARPTVVIGGPEPVRATIVGVVRGGFDQPQVYRVDRSAGPQQDAASTPDAGYGPPTLELWVPSGEADEVTAAVQHDLSLALPGVQVQAYRQDSGDLEKTLGHAAAGDPRGRRRRADPRRDRRAQRRPGDRAPAHPGDRRAAQLRRHLGPHLLRGDARERVRHGAGRGGRGRRLDRAGAQPAPGAVAGQRASRSPTPPASRWRPPSRDWWPPPPSARSPACCRRSSPSGRR